MGNQRIATSKPRYRKPDAVKELEAFVFAEKKRLYEERHPGTATYFLVSEKYRDDTANGLTRCIIDYIRLKGGQAERISTTGRVISSQRRVANIGGAVRTIGSTKYIPGTGTNGSADISATIAGRSVKIEVKIGTDRQSGAQKEYQRSVEASGGVYYIARDFTSFREWYHKTLGGQYHG